MILSDILKKGLSILPVSRSGGGAGSIIDSFNRSSSLRDLLLPSRPASKALGPSTEGGGSIFQLHAAERAAGVKEIPWFPRGPDPKPRDPIVLPPPGETTTETIRKREETFQEELPIITTTSNSHDRTDIDLPPLTTRNEMALTTTSRRITAGQIGLAGCDFITNPTLRQICLAAAGLLPGGSDSGAGDTRGASYGNSGRAGLASCPAGYEQDANGTCIKRGIGGVLQRALPGGKSGTLADVYGDPVLGYYGAGIVPVQVASTRFDCPPGMKLGKDDVCYEHLSQSQRKWPTGTKPLLTGGDVHALKRAKQLQKKIGRIHTQFGKKVHHVGSSSSRRKK